MNELLVVVVFIGDKILWGWAVNIMLRDHGHPYIIQTTLLYILCDMDNTVTLMKGQFLDPFYNPTFLPSSFIIIMCYRIL